MQNSTVDVFIPVTPTKPANFPAALYSALTQTYQPIRVILFLDAKHFILENLLDEWWYTPQDIPRSLIETKNYSRTGYPLEYEQCKRGVVIRNPRGPSGSAGLARQWLFDWKEKSDLVKMLDSDDILTPGAIETMIKYVTPESSGVFCPLIFCSHYKYARTIVGKPKPGSAGSGSMLLKREFMERAVKDGFIWDFQPGHDSGILKYIVENNIAFETTAEDVLYLYLK